MVMTVALPELTGLAVEAIRKGALHGRRPRGRCARTRSPHAAGARPGDPRRRARPLGTDLLAANDRRATSRWRVEYDLRERMYGQLQRLELGFFDHQQTGQLMSRATVDLQAVRFFLGYGLVFILQSILTITLAGAGDDRHQPQARPDRAGAGAVRGAHLLPLRPPRAPGDPGDPAAHRRADRGRRGEHLRGAGREGVRPRGPPADALSGHRRARVQPGDGRHAPGSDIQPRDRLPAPARPRGGAAAGRRVGDPRPPHASASSPRSTCT